MYIILYIIVHTYIPCVNSLLPSTADTGVRVVGGDEDIDPVIIIIVMMRVGNVHLVSAITALIPYQIGKGKTALFKIIMNKLTLRWCRFWSIRSQ